MKHGKLHSKKMVVLVAVVCLLACFSTVAAANGWLGLRDLTLPKQQVAMPVDPETGEREEQMVDAISLQGYAGTPENQAVAEWQNFLTNYDQDGSILGEIGNGPTGLDQKYDLYFVYTREMADNLDEIVEKYRLSLHTAIYDPLADSFDFTKLTPAVPLEVDSTETPDTVIPDPFYCAAGIQESVAQDFFGAFVKAIEEDRREDVAAMINWPRLATVPEGTFIMETAEDFLPYYDDIFTESLLETIHTNQYDKEWADLFTSSGMIGDRGGTIWFAVTEDGLIRVMTVRTPGGWALRSSGPAGVQRDETDRYTGRYDDDMGQPNLVIQKRADGTYDVQTGIFRLAALDDGVGELTEDGLVFSAAAPSGRELTGMITLDGDTATVTFTNAEWNVYTSENEYRYVRSSTP